MHAENLILHYCCQREVVEALYELLPELDREPPFALLVKPIDSTYCSTLVIASEKEHLGGVENLQTEEQCDALHSLVASVDVVSQKQVSILGVVGWQSSQLDQLLEILELTVDVSTYFDWRLDSLHDWLFFDNLLGLLNDNNNIALFEFHLFYSRALFLAEQLLGQLLDQFDMCVSHYKFYHFDDFKDL